MLACVPLIKLLKRQNLQSLHCNERWWRCFLQHPLHASHQPSATGGASERESERAGDGDPAIKNVLQRFIF